MHEGPPLTSETGTVLGTEEVGGPGLKLGWDVRGPKGKKLEKLEKRLDMGVVGMRDRRPT
jgi:hypothetical protein